MNMRKMPLIFMMICLVLASSSVVFAVEETNIRVSPLNKQEETIVLRELSLEKANLTSEEQLAILTKGTSVIWNKAYKSEYNIKKSFSMTASLITTGNKPYTTIKITNTGNTVITALAYKGSIGGSNTIQSKIIPVGKSKTISVSRSDVIKYGTMNGQGNRVTLAYKISVYNTDGKKISFKAYAKRYE